MWHSQYSSSMVLVKLVAVAVLLPHLCFGDAKPVILESSSSNINVPVDELAHLECIAHGHPVPVVTWTKGGTEITNDTKGFKIVQTSCSNQTTSHLLAATTSKFDWEGEYKCAAKNSRGEDTKTYKITTEVEEKTGLSNREIISICIGLGLGLLIILSIAILIWRADKRLKEAARRANQSRRNQGHENLAEDIQEIDAETNTKL